jgi:hypothetical protein
MINPPIKKFYKYFFTIILPTIVLLSASYTYAAISCSITTSAGCANTVMLRMSSGNNAHAELPSQSTSNYNNNVVCCSGVAGLSNSCSETNKATIVKLSGVTNAHVERNTENNYAQNACLASTYAGDQITIGYQTTNCTGYDTTLFSMSTTSTNATVGDTSAYSNKVCAKVVSQSISFNISNHTAGFGYLTSAAPRYATADGLGSNSDTAESYMVSASTNATSGYTIFVSGNTLSNGISTIDAIGGTNIPPPTGTNAFGMRAVATYGVGAVVSPYDGTGFAYDATSTTMSTVAEAASGNGVTTEYSIRTVATIDSILNYGNYSTSLTYIIVPNF